MVKCKYITPKHRAYAATARVDKVALPRILFMAAKYRARRPVPTLPPAWITVPMGEDALSFHPPTLKPYPMLAAEPLVPPERWRSLYSFSLERPPIPDIDPERIAHTQPEYKGLPPAHIRDAWVFMNYRTLGLYDRIFVDPPKTRLPNWYNVIIKDLGLASSPTHVFGVYSYAPAAELGDPAMRQARHRLKYRRVVGLFPTHAAIWAAHCANLPAIKPPPRDMPVQLLSEATAARPTRSIIRMPVVPVPLPYPPRFFALAMFVTTYSKALFIGHLLPCPHIPYILHETTVEGDANYCKLVGDLASHYGMRELCCLARGVFGTYQNMCVLGMVDDRIWEALHLAWSVLLKVMETVDARDR
ncbi:hypothetical protein LXA43DRAFT_315992 [Ganoderma leucocontextum]|nr:hypothetical protein LXA43DRAFT_315992 [Ganoderma leucocontextum]